MIVGGETVRHVEDGGGMVVDFCDFLDVVFFPLVRDGLETTWIGLE